MPSTPFPAAASLAFALGGIVGGIQKVYAVFMARNPEIAGVSMVFWKRLQRLNIRFQALARRAEAGTLRPARPSRASAAPPKPRAPRTRKPWVRNWAWTEPPDPPLPEATEWMPVAVRLGRKPGWMSILMGWRMACYASQLRQLVDSPDMAALLRQAPQAARLLRAMHYMVSTDALPACLQPPPRQPRAMPPDMPPDPPAAQTALPAPPALPALLPAPATLWPTDAALMLSPPEAPQPSWTAEKRRA